MRCVPVDCRHQSSLHSPGCVHWHCFERFFGVEADLSVPSRFALLRGSCFELAWKRARASFDRRSMPSSQGRVPQGWRRKEVSERRRVDLEGSGRGGLD